MRFILVTGMSGAGKSLAIHSFEDMGYYCVDNMMPALLPKFFELCNSQKNKLNKVAVVCDIRSGEVFTELYKSIDEIEKSGCECEILFLDANNEALIKRYKETRRIHPLGKNVSVDEAINKERKLLSELNARANCVINTSTTNLRELKNKIWEMYSDDASLDEISINIISFGFKYGIPIDSDLVFDVRFLPNPFYIEDLKNHTGLEECVSNYVMSFSDSVKFLDMLYNMINFLLPKYKEEGKKRIVVSIGCTGGRHRSVTIAEKLCEKLKNNNKTIINHRDCNKDEY